LVLLEVVAPLQNWRRPSNSPRHTTKGIEVGRRGGQKEVDELGKVAELVVVARVAKKSWLKPVRASSKEEEEEAVAAAPAVVALDSANGPTTGGSLFTNTPAAAAAAKHDGAWHWLPSLSTTLGSLSRVYVCLPPPPPLPDSSRQAKKAG